MRNAAMNSSRETLLREEEEQRKRFRFPIGLESDHETSPPGKPVCSRHSTTESRLTNSLVETLSDDDASDLILLKNLKIQILTDFKNQAEHPLQERTDRLPCFIDRLPCFESGRNNNNKRIMNTN